jgi:hypothetical protein
MSYVLASLASGDGNGEVINYMARQTAMPLIIIVRRCAPQCHEFSGDRTRKFSFQESRNQSFSMSFSTCVTNQIPGSEVPKPVIFCVIQHLRTQSPESRNQSFFMVFSVQRLRTQTSGRPKEIIFWVVQPLRVGKFKEPVFQGHRRNRPFATLQTLHPHPRPYSYSYSYSLFLFGVLYNPHGDCQSCHAQFFAASLFPHCTNQPIPEIASPVLCCAVQLSQGLTFLCCKLTIIRVIGSPVLAIMLGIATPVPVLFGAGSC